MSCRVPDLVKRQHGGQKEEKITRKKTFYQISCLGFDDLLPSLHPFTKWRQQPKTNHTKSTKVNCDSQLVFLFVQKERSPRRSLQSLCKGPATSFACDDRMYGLWTVNFDHYYYLFYGYLLFFLSRHMAVEPFTSGSCVVVLC